MSEERTQDIGQKYDTKPTSETILERLNTIGEEMRQGFAGLAKRFDDLDVRVDRVASETSATRADMLTLRADFKELKSELKEHFPLVK